MAREEVLSRRVKITLKEEKRAHASRGDLRKRGLGTDPCSPSAAKKGFSLREEEVYSRPNGTGL